MRLRVALLLTFVASCSDGAQGTSEDPDPDVALDGDTGEGSGADIPGAEVAADGDAEGSELPVPRADVVRTPPAYAAHPEPARLSRDVALVTGDAAFSNPYIPGHRTTMDGRIGIRVQGGPPGTSVMKENLSFYLFAPERLTEPVMAGPPGAQILAQPEPFDVPFPPGLAPDVDRTGHHAICDPTQEFAVDGEHTNPYVCGPGGQNDCYDFTIVSSTASGGLVNAQLWGTPVTIEVVSPKTPDARIIRAELGVPVAGTLLPFVGEWTEPAVTIDGRLLTGRFGRAPRGWTNPNTGVTITRPYDLAYSVLDEEFSPCDVRGWVDFHPISHAPYDPEMAGRYGLAAYPFRDAEGHPIADGEDVGGTYPWVDREGANVFMAAVPGRLAEQSSDKYPRRCVTPGCERYEENTDWDRGFMVAGLWTHGKFVHLDAMINNLDWAVGVTPAAHFWVDLYRDGAGAPVPVRFGAGRFIDAVRNAGGPYPPGYTHNANILDSMQNLLTHHRATTPVLPRDVVWHMSTGVATDEIEFDDYLDPTAFIVSSMTASVTPLYNERGESTSFPKHWNGQVRELTIPIPVASLYVLRPELEEEIHLQNAATSLSWDVPPFGLVDAGAGRVEPVALGGIRGRGFWLSGDNAIRYEVPPQEQAIADHSWYVAAFLDLRGGATELRTLWSFPDGSAVRTTADGYVEYVAGGAIVHTVTLPAPSGWTHLALLMEQGSRVITLHHDGFAIDRFTSTEPIFAFVPGVFTVGAAETAGVRGWIDELKVLTHAPLVEVRCNHALGTLVRVDDSEQWRARASAYPAWAHAEVGAAAQTPGTFACFHDYSRDYAAHLQNLPPGTAGLRDVIIFPEGPIRFGAPRPDSSRNLFCQSCHHDEGRGGLGTAALALDPTVNAEDDRRRQPMQPPRRVFGNIPAGWVPPGPGPGGPPTHVQAPPEGLLIDAWVRPASAD